MGGKRIRYSMDKILERDMCIDEQITQIAQNTYIYPWKSYDEVSTGVNLIIWFQENYLTGRYKDFDYNIMNKQISKFSNELDVFNVILMGQCGLT